jgi:hypothetical protein
MKSPLMNSLAFFSLRSRQEMGYGDLLIGKAEGISLDYGPESTQAIDDPIVDRD